MNDLPVIKLFNTLTRKKEELRPITEGHVQFYSCGQTVYEDVHIGNAKTFIIWDLLARTLRHLGYQVKHIQNFTDVGHLTDDADQGEDKIVKRARELKEHPMELVDRKINEYNFDMDLININRPNLAPRATAHISEMIDLIQTLLSKKHAYEHEGSIYFDISTFPSYGKMARLDLENLKAGARVEVIEGKRNPGDFALWIKAPLDHIMKYTSPWGKGYPGWHMECSVMAMKYLGDTIDIHAGGIDHIPIHHTNEIAQSEGATGKPFSNIWVHSEFITLNGEKMSKSKGNFISLRQLIEDIGKGPARFALSMAHYRTQADFSMEQAKAAAKTYFRMIRSLHRGQQYLFMNDIPENVEEGSIDHSQKLLKQFSQALADDLNTPQAFAHLNTVSKRIEQNIKNNESKQIENFVKTLELMLDVLGIPYPKLTQTEIENVNSLLAIRNDLRDKRMMEASDKIRNFLQSTKYVIQDQQEGLPLWYRQE